MVWEANRRMAGTEHNVVSPANYLDWKSQNDVLEGMAAASPVRSAVLIENGRAEEFDAQSVTANFFPMLGVRPVRGRLFTAEEDQPDSATCPGLISYRLWQNWFGGDENIVGRKVVINSQPSTIVGVLPPDFHFLSRKTDIWGCLGLNPAQDYRKTAGRWLLVAGRLRPGVNIDQARAHMTRAGGAARSGISGIRYELDRQYRIDARRAVPRDEDAVAGAPGGGGDAAGGGVRECCEHAAGAVRRSDARDFGTDVSRSGAPARDPAIADGKPDFGTGGGILGVMLARWAVAGLVALAPKDLAQSAGDSCGSADHRDRRRALARDRHFFRDRSGAGNYEHGSGERPSRRRFRTARPADVCECG